VDPVRKTNVITPHLQTLLWNQPPASSNKHVAGKLSLCVGMPVMLKHNEATECCMTKGAEGTVVGWQSSERPEGQNILDTLFVRLTNPPKTIKIDGLEENVVPITRRAMATMCTLPNDDEISISREQVLVLVNLGMTDYASQGRTRPNNPVDLNGCRSHQSYYTCLSRSSDSEGTIIVQGFDPNMITGGASGHLRQEFRELDVLDEITKLRYKGSLPDCVNSNRRNGLIHQFQQWKGNTYVPLDVHTAIRWDKHDPFEIPDVITDSPWKVVKLNKSKPDTKQKKSDTTGFIVANGSVPVVSFPQLQNKRKAQDASIEEANKRQKILVFDTSDIGDQEPQGLIWDGENYSCAYDSLMSILFSIWNKDPNIWNTRFKNMNRTMKVLSLRFSLVQEEKSTLEVARNKI